MFSYIMEMYPFKTHQCMKSNSASAYESGVGQSIWVDLKEGNNYSLWLESS